MRRDRLVALAVSTLWGIVLAVGSVATQTPAYAAPPSPAPTAASPTEPSPGQAVCTINRVGLFGISGIVAKPTGYVVVNDSQSDNTAAKIFFFDNACKAQPAVPYSSSGPYDVEDLALDKDGKLWIADTGDDPKSGGGSGKRRDTIALWTLGTGSSERPVIHRLKYPDGVHDAEALVMSGDGTPVIVTKEDEKLGSAAGLYVPAAPMKDNNSANDPVLLRRAGEVKTPMTTTSNPWSVVGHQLITGGAKSPDGKKVVLRTYSDAFEWDVPDGDVVKAITAGKPRATPLPNEPCGEAITYSADGASFITVSDVEEGKNPATPLLKYTPAVAAAQPKATKKSGGSGGSSGSQWDMQDLMLAVAGVGVFGLILVVVGVFGIRSSRRARRASAAVEGKARAKAKVAGTLSESPSGEISGNVYGSATASGGSSRGAVIKALPAGPSAPPSGGVYGKPATSGGGTTAGTRSQSSGGVYGKPAPSGGGYGQSSPPRREAPDYHGEYPSGEVSRRRGPGNGGNGPWH